jgi:serine/threonine protein kinase/tetratricopeptide (TPR) repeat protein
MKSRKPSEYEQLSPEAAARIDAICDRFEKAWRAAGSVTGAPRLESFLEGCDEKERTVLVEELMAMDPACRERYGTTLGPEESKADVGARAASAEAKAGHRQDGTGLPGFEANWPDLPGLELVEILASGGMGVIFKARQPTLDREVAVKLLRDAYVAGSEESERFVQEARAIARLRHPHLVQLYEFGEGPSADGITSRPYLVLEYVSGGSLAGALRGARLPPKEAARLVETIAEAIHHAHQQGIIHRDLKPANVLLAPNPKRDGREPEASTSTEEHPASQTGGAGLRSEPGVAGGFSISDFAPKVTDFGLAKFVTGRSLTRTGDVLGTPSYMAPEQATGKSPATRAVDVYGLGAILYEVLTGRPPFLAETAVATVRQVVESDPLPPRRLHSLAPRDLETICLKCLRKEPGRRYASAQELADDLGRFQRGEPIRARPVGKGERLLGWCRRKPLVAGLVAALAFVSVAALGGIVWQWHLAREKADEAERIAADVKREHDAARMAKEQADRNLARLQKRVDRLKQLGRDLWQHPEMHKTALSVMEDALAFYKETLAEEKVDSRFRLEAGRMYGEIAYIYHSLGQAGRAVEAYRSQSELLAALLDEAPADKDLAGQLAKSYRDRGNVWRDAGETSQARAAYDQAADLQERCLTRFTKDPAFQAALANTLVNKARLVSSQEPDASLALYQRAVELNRAALNAEPDSSWFQSELALALENQGILFLSMGRKKEAKASIGEALALHQKLLADGKMRGGNERYVADSYATQAKVLAATGQPLEAEKSFKEAVNLFEKTLKETPTNPFPREGLATALTSQADFLRDSGRKSEAVVIRRQAIEQYEILKRRFPEDSPKRIGLVNSYLGLVSLLWELGRQDEAAEPYGKAFAVAPGDPAANNELAWFLAATPELRLRDARKAVELAAKAVRSSPKTANYWNTLGVARYRAGDDRAAISALETSMKLGGGGDGYDWFFLATAHWRLDERKEARAWFDRAVQWMDKSMPDNAELRRFRAEAEAMLGARQSGQ